MIVYNDDTLPHSVEAKTHYVFVFCILFNMVHLNTNEKLLRTAINPANWKIIHDKFECCFFLFRYRAQNTKLWRYRKLVFFRKSLL